jgi:hypothetical protein
MNLRNILDESRNQSGDPNDEQHRSDETTSAFGHRGDHHSQITANPLSQAELRDSFHQHKQRRKECQCSYEIRKIKVARANQTEINEKSKDK